MFHLLQHSYFHLMIFLLTSWQVKLPGFINLAIVLLHLRQLQQLPILFNHSVVSYSFATPWTAASQAPLFMGFPRQEYWSGLPFPSLRDLPNPGIETASPNSPAFQADSLPLNQLRNPGVPLILCIFLLSCFCIYFCVCAF